MDTFTIFNGTLHYVLCTVLCWKPPAAVMLEVLAVIVYAAGVVLS